MTRQTFHLSSPAALLAVSTMTICTHALADVVVLNGLAADYHITLPEGTGAINTHEGIASNQRLGFFRETRFAPMGRMEGERRAILEFDLSLLGLSGINAATFSVFVPNQNSAVQTHAADLWGSSNRASTVNFDSPGAAGEYDAADYALVRSSAIPSFNPSQDNQRYDSSITAYLQARYTDYLNNPANKYVFLRMQVAPNAANVNSFYEISASESGVNAPQLIVTGDPVVLVPLPMGAWAGLGGLAVVGGMRASRRKRIVA